MSHPLARRRSSVVALTCAGLTLSAGALGALGGAATAVPSDDSAAPVADCAAPFPLADVAKGDLVDGLTVVSGTTPEAFTGEVLGVLNDGISPGIDMIMIDLDMPAFDETGGVWQGMSGSPVYADDGRLIGAVAYGLSYGPSTIAGITPFEDMDDYLSDDALHATGHAVGPPGPPGRRPRRDHPGPGRPGLPRAADAVRCRRRLGPPAAPGPGPGPEVPQPGHLRHGQCRSRCSRPGDDRGRRQPRRVRVVRRHHLRRRRHRHLGLRRRRRRLRPPALPARRDPGGPAPGRRDLHPARLARRTVQGRQHQPRGRHDHPGPADRDHRHLRSAAGLRDRHQHASPPARQPHRDDRRERPRGPAGRDVLPADSPTPSGSSEAPPRAPRSRAGRSPATTTGSRSSSASPTATPVATSSTSRPSSSPTSPTRWPPSTA